MAGRTLKSVSENCHFTDRSSPPTCIICSHVSSRTASPNASINNFRLCTRTNRMLLNLLINFSTLEPKSLSQIYIIIIFVLINIYVFIYNIYIHIFIYITRLE